MKSAPETMTAARDQSTPQYDCNLQSGGLGVGNGWYGENGNACHLKRCTPCHRHACRVESIKGAGEPSTSVWRRLAVIYTKVNTSHIQAWGRG